MTACDIAAVVLVVHRLLCCNVEHAKVPTA